VPLKNFRIWERRSLCCTSNSVVITFVKTPVRTGFEHGYLILSPKSTFVQNIPHVFAATFNRFIGIEQFIINLSHQVKYKIPLRDLDTLVVSITDLGIANAGAFKRIDDGLEVVLESDIFTTGPYRGFVPYFSKKLEVPLPYRVPDNLAIRLRCLHTDLLESVRVPSVSRADINRMAVSAFINEVRWLFSCIPCPKPVCKVEKCDIVEYERCYIDYCAFVTSCIKVIAYVETKVDVKCVFERPAYCAPDCNKYVCAQEAICNYAGQREVCAVQVCTDVNVLFEDVLLSECDMPVLPCLEAESLETCISSESDMEVKAPKKRAAVKVESKTSVSTYGWYVAGGVVAVSVAVAVYVFVL